MCQECRSKIKSPTKLEIINRLLPDEDDPEPPDEDDPEPPDEDPETEEIRAVAIEGSDNIEESYNKGWMERLKDFLWVGNQILKAV